MRLYTVLAPARLSGDIPEPMSLVFVKEGFCWPALIVPEPWLIVRRMWLVFVLYLATAVLVAALADRIGGALPWLLLILGRLFLALEGNGFRRWTLERRGYGLIAVVEGRNLAEAELRFFLAGQTPSAPAPVAAPMPPRPPPSVPPPTETLANRREAEIGDVVGFFPSPEGRA